MKRRLVSMVKKYLPGGKAKELLIGGAVSDTDYMMAIGGNGDD